ncbi:MAG: glycosyltransferase [Cyanobacteria bacterium SIG29]|nr:glycosyltransferase [Cyanobacteria bacterium SIG29]
MNILFLHRNFPAQFRHIAPALASNPNNKVVFITNNQTLQLNNITKINYRLKREVPKDCHRYLRFYEECVNHGQAVAEAAIYLKEQGFKPDVIYGHTWGQTMFMKDVFPDVPLLCYFEWFYDKYNGEMGFDGKQLSIDDYAKLRTKNAHLLIDLYSCDAGICPTNFQKKQFPKEFYDKIKVLHDGIDTEFCKPNEDVEFMGFTRKDEVITYATRGMEAYRGFPEFMQAVEILLKKRPNLHVLIGGEDRVCYGPQLVDTTYKKMMLEKLDLDLNRVHFVGALPLNEYVKLLQVTSCHIYLTYPFVASWSLLDAMSCACPIVASSTEPVKEFIEDGKQGLLFDFYNIEEQVSKIEYVLENKHSLDEMRNNARQTIIDNYNLADLLPKHIDYINSLARK